MMLYSCDIAYCRLIRRRGKSKYKYYIQVVFKGLPLIKRAPSLSGDVGIDIGVSTVAIVNNTTAQLLELADKAEMYEKEITFCQRKMDKSRRTTNPANYNSDGTVKKGARKWNRSNNYKKNQNRLSYLKQKQAAIRKQQHEELANNILSLGDKIYVETMDFKELQSKKKKHGKSIANRAPGLLLNILDRKLRYTGNELIKIDTVKSRASQFNHIDGTYTKKPLSQRWNDFDGFRIQRDLYSAFLIMNTNNDLDGFDINKCNERFDNFKLLHDAEVERLSKNKNNPKCMGL